MNQNFFAELKRRNVYKVAAAYAVVAWLLIQAASILFPTFEAPPWIMKIFVAMVALGFPVALIIAWAFEATPKGIERTMVADALHRQSRGRAWIYVVVIGGLLSVALFFLGRCSARYSVTPQQDAVWARAHPTIDKSIAVLPFDNLSRDPDNAFFAEGVQDEILTRLAKVADLKVIARTSTQKFKSAPENLSEIARQLGVANILEGSVQKANDQVRVNVQLINAATNAHLWAEIYDRKLTDIFAVESDIAKTIADALKAQLTGSEKSSIAKQPTANTEAYELYLKGRLLWQKRSGDNIPKAIAVFEQAIARDPNYATAYAGLSTAYVLLPYYAAVPQRDAVPKARAAALKALELDPNLAEAHVALGKLHEFEDLDLHEAITEYRRAIELQPSYATAHQWLGDGPLACLGQFEEAIAEGKRAVELDPLSPVINTDLGITLYYAKRDNEAVAQLQKAVALDPQFFYSIYSLGIALYLTGDTPGALALFEKARQLSDDPLMATLVAVAKTKMGDKKIVRQTLAALNKIDQRRQGVAYDRALLYLAMNNKAEAIRWLEQSYADHDGPNAIYFKVERLLDPLRGDPRFEALVQKVVGEKK